MNPVDLSQISIGIYGKFGPCPSWYSAFVNFAASISLDSDMAEDRQNFSIITVPRITGVTSALALGALYGEVYKVRSKASLETISFDQLAVGMFVSILCGTGGHQAVGEVTHIDINDRSPKVIVGNVVVSVKLIREIQLISGEIGRPKQFKKMEKSLNNDPSSLFGVLADSSLPIFRSLLMLRSTTGISESEFSLEFRDETTREVKSLRELINPIQANANEVGTTAVLNSTEEDQVNWLMSQLHLPDEDASPQLVVMGSASAILSQIENVSNKKVIAVLGRDERQITAAADAVRTTFAYSVEIPKKGYWENLPANTELVSFDRFK